MPTKQEFKNPVNLVEEYIKVHSITDAETIKHFRNLAEILNQNYTMLPK